MKTNKHTNVDKSLYKEEQWLLSCVEVKKVINGEFRRIHHRMPSGKFKISGLTDAGIRLTAYSEDGVRTIFLCIESEQKPAFLNILKTRGYASVL